MFNTLPYLIRLLGELDNLLFNSTITDVFTQEKNELYLEVSGKESFFLVFSVEPGYQTIRTLFNLKRSKKNSLSLFPELIGKSIIKIEFSNKDRVFRLITENSKIYFFIRGKESNFVIINNDLIKSFKKHDHSILNDIIIEYDQHNFLPNKVLLYPDLTLNDLYHYDVFKQNFPFLNKTVHNELLLRFRLSNNLENSIKSVMDDIYYNEIKIGVDKSNKIRFLPTNFKEHLLDIQTFPNYLEAINSYFKEKNYIDNFYSLKKTVSKRIESELTRIVNKISSTEKRILSGSKEQIYRKYGNLIISNLSTITKGSKLISLQDLENNEEFEIEIDEKLSPKQNADKYFEKARNEKIAFEKSKILLNDTLLRKNLIENEIMLINESNDPKYVLSIARKYKLQGVNMPKKEEDNFKFREFILEDKFRVLVGKDSKSNDFLSIKYAKQNDYWFHARGVPGSHVILQTEKGIEVPKTIIRICCSIAAFFSKAKTAGTVPVIYTFAKYVTKKRGMPPGQVNVLKENVLLVTPELPKQYENYDE